MKNRFRLPNHSCFFKLPRAHTSYHQQDWAGNKYLIRLKYYHSLRNEDSLAFINENKYLKGIRCPDMDSSDGNNSNENRNNKIEKKTTDSKFIAEQLNRETRERKRLELKLQLASKRIEDILDSLFVFVGVFTTDGVLLQTNDEPLEAAILKKSDVIGKPAWETYWWSYSVEIQTQVKRVLEQAAAGKIVHCEIKTRLSDQKFIDLDITFGALYDPKGKISQLIASSIDITERLDAENNLARKTVQLQILLEFNLNFFFHLDMEGTILGYEREPSNEFLPVPEFSINKNIDEIFPQSIAEKFHVAISEVGRTNKSFSFEFALIINHLEHWFHAHISPFLSNEIVVFIQDINEHKSAEIEINNLHIRFFEVQRLAHIGSWEWNLKDNTLWWSEEVYCIFGLNDSQFQPDYKSSLRLIHPDDRELVKRVIINTLKIDLPFSIEHRIIRSDGEIRHVHEQAALKKNLDNETIFMYGTIQDITEKHEASRMVQDFRDELAHVSRLAVIGELAAGLSHELNQPLTAIANYCSSMKNVLEQGGDVTELATKIDTQSLRSGEIINRIKSLVTKRKRQQSLININDSIRNSLQLINYKIRLQQIKVNLVNENNFTTAYADRVQIEQVLVNLIKNAVEAMEETPLPRILTITTATADDSMIVISVADTGTGVPVSFMDQLFTPFATNKKGGMGIGLSLSRSLIDASGGKMWHTPNSNGGATFHVSLPAAQSNKKK